MMSARPGSGNGGYLRDGLLPNPKRARASCCIDYGRYFVAAIMCYHFALGNDGEVRPSRSQRTEMGPIG